MHRYAQTNIQLYNQLQQQGYALADLVQVRRACDLGVDLMPGHFRPSGKPMEAHLAGTASILAYLETPLHVVVAGLLHAVYAAGDFGTLGPASPAVRRRKLLPVVGEKAEELLHAYHAFSWNSKSILQAASVLEQKTPLEKEVLLIRLANDLEDNLDIGVLYCPNRESRLKYLEQCGEALVKIAEALGYPSLAMELAESHRAILDFGDMDRLPIADHYSREHLLVPATYRQRLLPATCRGLTRLKGRIVAKARGVLRRG